ncbi:MAG: hypothetical protein ACI4HI_11015 [Lachnospiraceae bacterium]
MRDFLTYYFETKRIVESVKAGESLNVKCIKAFEQYLSSKVWCRNEVEYQLYIFSLRGVGVSRMKINVKRKGKEKQLQPESVRSARSRLSKRFYHDFGEDFHSLLLADDDNPIIEKRLQAVILKCRRLRGGYQFENHYAEDFTRRMDIFVKAQGDVKVPKNIEFSEEIMEALEFYMGYDQMIFEQQLKKLNVEAVAIIYQVLRLPEYGTQREMLLEQMRKMITSREERNGKVE